MIGRFSGGIADGQELPIDALPNILRVSEYPPDGELSALDGGDDEPGTGVTSVYKIRTTGPYGRYDFILNPAAPFCTGAEWGLLWQELTATYFPGELSGGDENDALARVAAGEGVWETDVAGDGEGGSP